MVVLEDKKTSKIPIFIHGLNGNFGEYASVVYKLKHGICANRAGKKYTDAQSAIRIKRIKAKSIHALRTHKTLATIAILWQAR